MNPPHSKLPALLWFFVCENVLQARMAFDLEIHTMIHF